MAEVILMPQEGVISLHIEVGEIVEKGDLLAEIVTDKALFEIESHYDGTILHIGIDDGGKLRENELFAIIGNPDEDVNALLAQYNAFAPSSQHETKKQAAQDTAIWKKGEHVVKKEENNLFITYNQSTKPSFVLGYWRPWKENSSLFNSYLDYVKDTSLIKYGADIIGNYINQASKEQINAINRLGEELGRGLDVLNDKMTVIANRLLFLNRNLDIIIEHQKLSNLLLENIAELLRVPDNEKIRQRSIELGVKFFVNAAKDADIYADALEELLKAESLMKQDYFVLHRIGCIYLYVEKFLNPEKALEYFLRAAKYASTESDSNAVYLANILASSLNKLSTEEQIGLLAADSYEKAAFAAYVLGRFSDAVIYQSKALKLNNIPQNYFLLAKYQIRNNEINEGINNLEMAIDDKPEFAIAVFREIDLMNDSEVLNLLSKKNKYINKNISMLANRMKTIESSAAEMMEMELNNLLGASYEIKVSEYEIFKIKFNELCNEIELTKVKIDSFASNLPNFIFCTFGNEEINKISFELNEIKALQFEKMIEGFERIKKSVDSDKLKIGSKYAGGIVFYLDKSEKHGLVCAEDDFGEALWIDGTEGPIGSQEDGIGEGIGLQNSLKIEKHYRNKILFNWFLKKPAAKICLDSNHNGYNDWYLPTVSELILISKNLRNKVGELKKHSLYWSSVEGRLYKIYKGYAIYSDKNYSDRLPLYDGENPFNSSNLHNFKNKFSVRAVRAF